MKSLQIYNQNVSNKLGVFVNQTLVYKVAIRFFTSSIDDASNIWNGKGEKKKARGEVSELVGNKLFHLLSSFNSGKLNYVFISTRN